MTTQYVNTSDINNCIELVEIVKDDFAGYKKDEFLETLKKCINKNEAIAELDKNLNIIGLLMFSHKDKELEFLAVHPLHRKNGIAKNLIKKMFSSFKSGEQVHVITFRDGDKKGIAARKCYHSCGFKDGELITVFDYPCQRMNYIIQ